MSDSLRPHGLYSPWNSPGQNTGVDSCSLLQGIFPTKKSNSGLLHCRWILYQPSHQGSPRILEQVAYPFSSRSSWPRNLISVSCIIGRFFTRWATREAPSFFFSSVQSLSRVRLFATPLIAACQASLSIINSRSLPKLMSIESVMPSSHLILCHPLLLLPPIPPSIRIFSNESTLPMRCQNIGVSALASGLPMNTQDWSPLEWTGWISLQSRGFSDSCQCMVKTTTML